MRNAETTRPLYAPYYGRRYNRKPKLSAEQIIFIARNFYDKGAVLLSSEMGVSQGQINYAVFKLRKFGIDIPHRSRDGALNRAFREALKVLKK